MTHGDRCQRIEYLNRKGPVLRDNGGTNLEPGLLAIWGFDVKRHSQGSEAMP